MAKQSVSTVERHLEKAVLGVCVAVLLAAVALYLVASPNTIEMANQTVRPNTIDVKFVEAGKNLGARLRNVAVDTVKVEDAVPLLQAPSDPLAYANLLPTLRSAAPFLPPVPQVVEPRPAAGELQLAAVLEPGKPSVTVGRSTLILLPPQKLGVRGSSELTNDEKRQLYKDDVNWVTVASKYDVQKQIEVCRKAGYKTARRTPLVIAVDLQRREKLVDGSYSQWEDVKGYAPVVPPDEPEVRVSPGIKDPVVTQEIRERVQQYMTLLEDNQMELYRPMFPERRYGAEWAYPDIDGLNVSDLDEELQPNNGRVYPGEEAARGVEKTAEQLLAEARQFLDVNKWREARRLADQVLKIPDLKQNVQRAADRVTERADQIETNVRLGRIPDPYKEDDKQVAKRPMSRYQVAWAHDAAGERDGGALSGRVYQYRIRLRMFNRFCAIPTELKDAQDSEKVALLSEWSDPSVDVYIPPDTRFFLTSGNPIAQKGAKVTIFKWYEGTWVRHAFPVEVGKPIGGAARETVRIQDGRPDKPMIDFDTDSIVVDIDYDYSYREKKSRRRGFRIEGTRKTVAMVFADANGFLHQRVLLSDKGAEYKRYKEKVRK